ncbi:MAG TPA: hypothetical protein VKB08_08625, partial [Bradyrhizobium sp.]|nr:hypothetical protein [Bradyrhizobium sp.]
MTEEDDTAKPLSPLESKLAAIAAASAARDNLSTHVPSPAAAEPETTTQESAVQPALPVEGEIATEPPRAEENALATAPPQTPPLATQFAAMPREGESPPVQPAIPDAT